MENRLGLLDRERLRGLLALIVLTILCVLCQYFVRSVDDLLQSRTEIAVIADVPDEQIAQEQLARRDIEQLQLIA